MPESRPRILVVDDDDAIVEFLLERLRKRYEMQGTTSALEAVERVADIDLLITDVEMPEMSGSDLLAAAQRKKPGLLALVMTAFGRVELAVETVRAGASDFITKPFQIETLIHAIDRALRERQLHREIVQLRRDVPARANHDGMIGQSEVMQNVMHVARRAADCDAGVLLEGEPGVGKRSLAHWIHRHGARAGRPFRELSCAMLPSALLEGELFGRHADGYRGIFAEGNRGTLYLAEVDELSQDTQTKLLHVLEGSLQTMRLIVASRQPLADAVRAGRFRRDLFARLDVIPLAIPPLRDRRADIPDLVHFFLGRSPRTLGIADAALRWLVSRNWPGNVRQLAHVIDRAAALTDHDAIVLEDVEAIDPLPDSDALEPLLGIAASRHLPLAEIEHAYIRRVVEAVAGNMSLAARILQIDRRTLYRKLAGQP